MTRVSWNTIRPAWILAILILVGWFLGLVGDQFTVCPRLIPSVCRPLTYFMAQNNAIVIYLGQYFQLFTSIFVTDSSLDAAFNAIAVLIIDRLADDTLNKARYFLIFFFTALIGNLFTLFQGPNYPASAGASGGIFGIFAAVFAYSWAKEKRVEISTFAFFLLIFVGSSFLIPDVNWVAHLGGAVGGFLCGPILYRTLKNRENELDVNQSSQFTDLATLSIIFLVTILSIIQLSLFA